MSSRGPAHAGLLAGLAPVRAAKLVRADERSAEFATDAGTLRIESWGPQMLRITLGDERCSDCGLLVGSPDPQPLAASESGPDGTGVVTAGECKLIVHSNPLRLEFACGGKTLLAPSADAHFARRFRIPPLAAGERGCAIAFGLSDSERIYGFGEKWSSLDKRGELISSCNEDSLGGNAEQSYKNVPFAFSTAGWGVYFNTPSPSVHCAGYAPVSHSTFLSVLEDRIDLFVFAGDAPADLLAHYHRLTGLPGAVPAWSFGPWLSRAYYRTADELLESARGMRERDLPCTTICLDGRTWLDTDTRFAFEWDPARYPDPTRTIAQLKELDYRICVWAYPYCSTRNTRFAELAEQGTFLKTAHGDTCIYRFAPDPFGEVLTQLPDSALVDFTAEAGRKWWADGCRQLADQGIDAIKTDFGEHVPDDAHAANGMTGRSLRNAYALLYAKTTHDALAAAGHKAPVLWARAGCAGSQRFPVHWTGDSQSSWGGLRTAVRGALNWMLSGAAYSSSDVGGFYGDQPSPELYVRWLQYGVLSSHLRMHGIGLREPYAFGEEALRIARLWLGLRERLQGLLAAAAEQAAHTGMPVMRPLALAFPESFPAEREAELAYMLGDSLLCCPITDPSGRSRHWLPPGQWTDLFTRKTLAGHAWIEQSRPLAEAPVYAANPELAEELAAVAE